MNDDLMIFLLLSILWYLNFNRCNDK